MVTVEAGTQVLTEQYAFALAPWARVVTEESCAPVRADQYAFARGAHRNPRISCNRETKIP